MKTQVDDFIEENSLAHYGVLGMKWGVRKAESVSSAPKDPPSENHLTAQEIRRKKRSSGVRSLSNRELQTFITRANLERQYSAMDPTAVKKGHDYVKTALAGVALVSSVYAVRNNPLVKAVGNAIMKKTMKG